MGGISEKGFECFCGSFQIERARGKERGEKLRDVSEENFQEVCLERQFG